MTVSTTDFVNNLKKTSEDIVNEIVGLVDKVLPIHGSYTVYITNFYNGPFQEEVCLNVRNKIMQLYQQGGWKVSREVDYLCQNDNDDLSNQYIENNTPLQTACSIVVYLNKDELLEKLGK